MKEPRRQIIHILFGAIFIIAFQFLGNQLMLIFSILALFIGTIFSEEIKKGHLPKLKTIVEKVERQEEQTIPGKGAIIFFLGFVIILLLNEFIFKNDLIVLIALIPTIFGDGFATLIGSKLGNHKILSNKTIEGSVIGFFVSFIMLSILLPEQIFISFMVAFMAFIVELLPINDNLSIPISSSILAWFLL